MAKAAGSGTPQGRGARASRTQDFAASASSAWATATPLDFDALMHTAPGTPGPQAHRNEWAEYRDQVNKQRREFAQDASWQQTGLEFSHFTAEYSPRYSSSEEWSFEEMDSRANADLEGSWENNRQIPTSTIDPERPRTVAAWWNVNPERDGKGTLTVIFRDGTPWNYYNVPSSVWTGFQASISKGRGWINKKNYHQSFDGVLNQFENGPGSLIDLTDEQRRVMLARARAQQGAMAARSGKKKRAYSRTLGQEDRYTMNRAAAYDYQTSKPNRYVRSAKASAQSGGTNPNKTAGKPRTK